MIISISNLKINATSVNGPVKIIDKYPTVSWDYSLINRVQTTNPPADIASITQASPKSYEIRLGTSISHLETDIFFGDIIQTGIVLTQETSWRYTGQKLRRGTTYFGQIRLTDSLDNISDWTSFALNFNSLPTVSSLIVTPSHPSITDDLILTYTFTDLDSDLESGSMIWWYKNGVRERQFDNLTKIHSKYLNYTDEWYAVVVPSDGYELGVAGTSNTVSILTTAPVADNLSIIPQNPTTADPLYAKYDLSSFKDSSEVTWYVNNVQIDEKGPFLRYNFNVGDTVSFTVSPSDGISTGTVASSSTVTIGEQPFYVVNLKLSSESIPLQVVSSSPTVSWSVIGPEDRSHTKTSIKIGTSPNASNIFEGELDLSATMYTIPSTLLESGRDYYITVAVGDETGYGVSSTLHFRTQGSRWFDNVDNAIGWTIESTFKINSGYQGFRIYDGAKHAELRFYVDKIQLISNNTTEYAGAFSSFSTITIVGKGSDIYVYQNYDLIVDGTGLLVQPTTDRFIEFGSINSSDTSSADYLNLYYTTQYNFAPTDAAYTEMAFNNFYEIDGAIDYITSANGEMYFAASSGESGASSAIYRVSDYKRPITATTVNKTFTPINRIVQSPNGQYTYLCHGRGATLFNNYAIGDYDSNIDFTTADSIVQNGWDYISSNDNASLDSNGLTIDTSVGGKAYYSQRQHGSRWFDFVSNDIGWTVSFTLKVNSVNDSASASNEPPDGCGIFASDGKYWETIYFLKNSVYFANAKVTVPFDTSLVSTYTVTGKNNGMKLYAGTELIAEVPLTAKSTKEGNSNRPQIVEDSNGEQHAVWHDDGDGILTVYYASTKNGIWGNPEQIVGEKFGSAHPSITLGNNKVFVAFESYRNDLTDIGMVIKDEHGWGEPFIVSSGLNISGGPRIGIDASGALHIVWEDYRKGQPQIFYKKFSLTDAKWSSDIQLTNSAYGCNRPSLAIDTTIWVTYTERTSAGLTLIKALGNSGSGWTLSTTVSSSYVEADYSDIVLYSGIAYITWHDINSGNDNYQIYTRRFNASFAALENQVQITNSTIASRFPSIGCRAGADSLTGNVYVVYECGENLAQSSQINVTNFTPTFTPGSVFTINGLTLTWDGTSYSSSCGDGGYQTLRLVLPDHYSDYITGDLTGYLLSSPWLLIGQDNIFPVGVAWQATISPSGAISYLLPMYGIDSSSVLETGVDSPIDWPSIVGLPPDEPPVFVPPYVQIAYFDQNIGRWLSKYQLINVAGNWFGGIDVVLVPPDVRASRRPAIAKYFSHDAHILCETEAAFISNEYSEYGDEVDRNPSIRKFVTIRDAVYDLTYESQYMLGYTTDIAVSGVLVRKELRVGDFSDVIGGNYLFKDLKTYTLDAVGPFSISLISKATTPIPSDRTLAALPSNNGDAWIGTNAGLAFFFNQYNQLATVSGNLPADIIRCITLDKNGFLFVGTGSSIYVSYDHINFYELTLSGVTLTSDITDLAVDSKNNLWVGTASMGVYRLGVERLIFQMVNGSTAAPQPITDVTSYSVTNGLPSYYIARLAIDALDMVWAATDNGLVRIAGNAVSVFGTDAGLPSPNINDIAIVNNGSRYIATSNGIAEMNGSTITPVMINHPEWNGNIRSLCWKNPNLLFAGSMSNLFQIVVSPDKYDAYVYPPSAYTADAVLYDDLKTYYIVGIDSGSITANSLFQVYVNKRNIRHGFSVSQKDGCWAVTFLQPLQRNDIVEVLVRNDIVLYADLQQNRAEQIAYGPISRIVKKFITNGVNLFATTSGSNALLRYNYAAGYSHPYDKIGLDTTPPSGTLKFDSQIDRRHVQLSVTDATDNLSGIESMKISNYPNFTSDGSTELPWVPFETPTTHDLGLDLGLSSVELNFSATSGSKIALFNNGTVNTLFACTSSPLMVYSYNATTAAWSYVTTIESSTPSTECKFMAVYKNRIVIGTGASGGTGKIYVSLDGSTFNLLASINGEFAYCASILNDTLYIGTGPNGKIYAYDGTNMHEVYTGLGTNIYALSGYNNKLYAATGEQGRLYSWDPVTNVALISSIDTDTQLNAVLGMFIPKPVTTTSSSSSAQSGDNVIFLGTNNTSKISKSVNKSPFITSFITATGSSVKFIKVFNGTIYAAINRTLYYYHEGVWLAKKSVTSPIEDLYVDPDENIWIITEDYIYVTKSDITQKTVYLQLKDRAGNETIANTAGLNVSVSINDLESFTHVNRILEVDEYGTPVFTYDGDSTFFSAERITSEKGIYTSEIFNGTNDHVMWSQLYWDAIVPDGTDLTVSIRSASTKDALLAASWTDFTKGQYNGVDISTFSGQFIQFKLTLTSTTRDISPSVYKVVITSVIRSSVHYFTTNFIMPKRVTKGILTATTIIPVSADIVFGIDTNNSTDFTDYQVIEPNKVFVLGGDQLGTNLRIGAKLISPVRPTLDLDTYPSSDPIHSQATYLNVVNFTYTNSGSSGTFHFKVMFYNDFARTDLAETLSTQTSTEGWSAGGVAFPSAGIYIANSGTSNIIASIEGTSALRCNQYYYTTVQVWNGVSYSTVNSNHSFIAGCNTTYVDRFSFSFTNSSGSSHNYHFRVSLYEDAARTSTVQTFFSGTDNVGWTVNSVTIPTGGTTITNGSTVTVEFLPDVSSLTYEKVYYASVDYYNGQDYVSISQGWTFRVQPISSEYCGEYSDVPILKNFAIMFELEDGEFVMLNV